MGPTGPREIHLDTVLIGLPFFTPTPALFSLNGPSVPNYSGLLESIIIVLYFFKITASILLLYLIKDYVLTNSFDIRVQ